MKGTITITRDFESESKSKLIICLKTICLFSFKRAFSTFVCFFFLTTHLPITSFFASETTPLHQPQFRAHSSLTVRITIIIVLCVKAPKQSRWCKHTSSFSQFRVLSVARSLRFRVTWKPSTMGSSAFPGDRAASTWNGQNKLSSEFKLTATPLQYDNDEKS